MYADYNDVQKSIGVDDLMKETHPRRYLKKYLILLLPFFLAACNVLPVFPGGLSPEAVITVTPNTTVEVGTPVTLDGRDSADDGSIESYEWSLEAPAGSAVETDGVGETFRFVPDVAGTYTVTLTVTYDSGETDEAEVEIVAIRGAVDPPVAVISGEPDSVIEVGTRVELSGSQSENAASYRWTLTAPDGSTLSTGTEETFSFTPEVEGSYGVQLTVESSEGLESSDKIFVRAQEPALPGEPQVDISGEPTTPVTTGQRITLDGSGSTGGDSAIVSYEWEVEAPSGSALNGLTGSGSTLSFTPDVAGSYRVALTVTDGDGKSDSTSVRFVAENPNTAAPVADAGSDQSTPVGQSVTLNASNSSDPDGGPLSYAWTLNAPSGSSLDGATSNSATFPFTPDVEGAYTATLRVSDGELTSTDTVVVTAYSNNSGTDIIGISPVRSFMTGLKANGSQYPVPSIDPKGVEYVNGSLFVIDSEIDESRPGIYDEVRANFFQIAPGGSRVLNKWDLTSAALGRNNEPAGLVYCEGYFFISNDNTHQIFRYRLEGNTLTLVDSVSTEADSKVGSRVGDEEGLACDADNNLLYVTNGWNKQILVYSYAAGFETLELVDRLAPTGFPDSEGIAFDPVSGNLFIAEGDAKEDVIIEYTTSGDYVQTISLSQAGFDISPVNPGGLDIDLSSDGSGSLSFYITDARGDNNVEGDTFDGTIYEAKIIRGTR